VGVGGFLVIATIVVITYLFLQKKPENDPTPMKIESSHHDAGKGIETTMDEIETRDAMLPTDQNNHSV